MPYRIVRDVRAAVLALLMPLGMTGLAACDPDKPAPAPTTAPTEDTGAPPSEDTDGPPTEERRDPTNTSTGGYVPPPPPPPPETDGETPEPPFEPTPPGSPTPGENAPGNPEPPPEPAPETT